METILGYTPDELIGHTPFEYLHQDAIGHTPFEYLHQDAIEPYQKKFQTAVKRHKKSVLHVSTWIHKNGNEVLLESNAIPMYDNNGAFTGLTGIDRKR